MLMVCLPLFFTFAGCWIGQLAPFDLQYCPVSYEESGFALSLPVQLIAPTLEDREEVWVWQTNPGSSVPGVAFSQCRKSAVIIEECTQTYKHLE